jgi:hypothetical protein
MTEAKKAPKAFVSHASEDKDRFVLAFAERLRARGIDAWVDKWEILPGDSLIDKIFEEGLKNADAVIVVLSRTSVQKAWVKEELNASIVKKINSHTKVIPVVIDECEVPEALQSVAWERIKNLDSYDSEFERIVASIFEHRERPGLGKPPSYSVKEFVPIPNLTRIDNLVLQEAGGVIFEHDGIIIDAQEFLARCAELSISPDSVLESLEVLENRGYVELTRTIAGIGLFKMTLFGKDEYASAYVPDYSEASRSIAMEIINHQSQDKSSISQRLSLPGALVDLVLEKFALRRYLKLVRTMGDVHIVTVSPELRRAFQDERD